MLATASSNIPAWWRERVAGACCLLLSSAIGISRPLQHTKQNLTWGELARPRHRETPQKLTGLTQDFCFLLVPTNLHGLSASASAARSTPARHSPGKASQEERGIFVDPEGKITLGCLMGCPGGSRQSRASYLCIDECHQTRSFRKALDLGLKTSTEGNS